MMKLQSASEQILYSIDFQINSFKKKQGDYQETIGALMKVRDTVTSIKCQTEQIIRKGYY